MLLKLFNVVRLEVIGAMTVFWCMTPCSLVWIRDRNLYWASEQTGKSENSVKNEESCLLGRDTCPLKVNRHFGGTCRLHLCG
jgi:hypothetical protein